MTSELRHVRRLRTILLSSAVVVVGCAMQGPSEDEPTVLRHEGHDHAAPAAQTARVDAGRADAGPADAGAARAPASCPNTYDAIQATIFDSTTYKCSTASCHGTAGGHIDLRKGFSYDSLLGLGEHAHDEGEEHSHAEGEEHAHAVALAQPVVYHDGEDHGDEGGAHDHGAHVIAGKPEESVLYDNLRAKLQNVPTKLGGTPMPLGGPAITKEQLKAVELWIAAGAPRTGFVAGTQDLCPKNAAADAGHKH